jgi:hypothetical protein
MAKLIHQSDYISVNSVDLSYWGFNIDVNLQKDQVEVTGFNSTGTKEYLPGNKDEEIVASFRQDYGNGGPDQTLWPLYNGGSAFPIAVRPTSGSATNTNPVYSGSATLYEYHPIDGALGAVSEIQCTFKVQGGLTRGTA